MEMLLGPCQYDSSWTLGPFFEHNTANYFDLITKQNCFKL